MKIKKGSIIVYVLALVLVTAGYWTYISKESGTLETVSIANQNTTNTTDEHLGDATLVSNNEVIEKEDEKDTTLTKQDEYFQESKLSRGKKCNNDM